MACRLFSAKRLGKLTQAYSSFDYLEQILMTCESKHHDYHTGEWLKNVVCKNDGHFVSA